MRLRAPLEYLETLVGRALNDRALTGALRQQIVALDLLRAHVDPITRARIERLSTLIALCKTSPGAAIVGTGAPRFKQWTCAASGGLTINGVGAPAMKQWTCVASGTITVPFSPSDLSGLSIWLDANVGVVDTAGNVDSWADQSGNAYDFTQTGSNRPTIVAGAINGHPAVRFTAASSQFMVGPAASAPQNAKTRLTNAVTLEYTGFVVLINNLAAPLDAATPYNSPALIADNVASGGDNIGFHLGNDKFAAYHWIGSVAAAEPTISTATPIQVSGKWATGGPITGKTPSQTSTFATATGPSSVGTGVNVVVGASGVTRHYFNGDIGEIVWYNRILNSTEIGQVETYLASKWGV